MKDEGHLIWLGGVTQSKSRPEHSYINSKMVDARNMMSKKYAKICAIKSLEDIQFCSNMLTRHLEARLLHCVLSYA